MAQISAHIGSILSPVIHARLEGPMKGGITHNKLQWDLSNFSEKSIQAFAKLLVSQMLDIIPTPTGTHFLKGLPHYGLTLLLKK